MEKNSSNGKQNYEGFCLDLLEAIAEHLGFSYTLYLVPDGKFGAQDTTTKEWNGLVKELIDKVKRNIYYLSDYFFIALHIYLPFCWASLILFLSYFCPFLLMVNKKLSFTVSSKVIYWIHLECLH